jgi:hypothetical protein
MTKFKFTEHDFKDLIAKENAIKDTKSPKSMSEKYASQGKSSEKENSLKPEKKDTAKDIIAKGKASSLTTKS